VRVGTSCSLYWDPNNTNKNTNPLFANQGAGDFHLKQITAGESSNSPCVNAGSDLASNLGFALYTTRTDGVPDRTTVDMGYHYLAEQPCRFADLRKDGIINFYDLAKLADKWLDEDCNVANSWCGGADLTFYGLVWMDDLSIITGCWMAEDVIAPLPNPSQWAIEPYGVWPSSVKMKAADANDVLWGLPVQYKFECVTGSCHDSNYYDSDGWLDSPDYNDVGLSPDTDYAYRVKTRDIAGNETEWSAIRYATIGADNQPPSPSPMTWATPPEAASSTSVRMVATTATDASGVVEYEFNEPNRGSSGWRSDPCYLDTDLDPNGKYCYSVRARDKYNNTTAWSAEACAGNIGDQIPPAPPPIMVISDVNNVLRDVNTLSGQFMWDPGAFDFDWWHKVIVNVAGITDDSGGPVEIRFICTSDNNFSSNNKIPAELRPIVINPPVPVALGSKGQGWRLTYTGSYIVYDVYTGHAGGTGWTLNWKVCAYDAVPNEACSAVHTIGPSSP
jgi:hypothetical protein